jgi:glycosyltransferase involved in cell wall biosynthesis
MTLPTRDIRPVSVPPDQPLLDLVVPVYNEEKDLVECVERLRKYLLDTLPYHFRITIADNASTDGTLALATGLVEVAAEVRLVSLGEKGRGRALQAAWLSSDAPILAYVDVDLSTDLGALLPLIAPLLSGHSDVAIGTRLSNRSRVVRGVKREVISRGYNVILHALLGSRFTDAQCGFKAIRADVARQLLPLVADTKWFFDTELLVLAERAGLRIHEVPVDWIEDPDSRVRIASTAFDNLRGICRLGKGFLTGAIPIDEVRARSGRRELITSSPPLLVTLLKFGLIGAVSTVAYMVLFALLRNDFTAQLANFLALLVTAVANTAANRRWSFDVRGRRSVLRHQAQGLAVFFLGFAITSGSLLVLQSVAPTASRTTELAVLVAANLLATLLRFLLLRGWVFTDETRDI